MEEKMNTAVISAETLIDLGSSDECHSQQIDMIRVLISSMESWNAVDVIAKILGVESYDEKKEKERRAKKEQEERERQEAEANDRD